MGGIGFGGEGGLKKIVRWGAPHPDHYGKPCTLWACMQFFRKKAKKLKNSKEG